MPIRFRCSSCNQLISIATKMAGRDVACPTCKTACTVPQADQLQKVAPALAAASQQSPAPETKPKNPWDDDEETEDEEFQLRRRGGEEDELDMTPMVDVTFLLLIFFMITASFTMQKTLQVPPPDKDEKGAATTVQTLEDFEEESVIVNIDSKSVVYVEDEAVSDPSGIADALRDNMRAGQKFEIVITAHVKCMHEIVVKVIDAANEVGMQRIRLATSQEDD
ncbi:MAG: hypothetical protein CMJ78_15250 [Planctomycetaceae bacterium]|nr:hypothetical protein [Planctomycetaceae bacterium]